MMTSTYPALLNTLKHDSAKVVIVGIRKTQQNVSTPV